MRKCGIWHILEDEQKLAEGDFAILVVVHLDDHILQAYVGLWSAQFLHHVLQFGEIEIAIVAGVVSVDCKKKVLNI